MLVLKEDGHKTAGVKRPAAPRNGEGSVAPDPNLQPELIEHPLVVDWIRHLRREAARGGATFVKQGVQIPVRFLVFAVKECGINYAKVREEAALEKLELASETKAKKRVPLPFSAVERIASIGPSLAQKFINEWAGVYPSTLQSSLSIIRRFLRHLKAKGLYPGDPAFLTAPGVGLRFEHPLVHEWIRSSPYSNLSGKNHAGAWNSYLGYIAKKKGLSIDPEKETAAWEALKNGAETPHNGSPKATSLSGTAVAAACLEADIWAPTYAKELGQPGKRRVARARGFAQARLSSIRRGYHWLRAVGVCDFDPKRIINPFPSDARLPRVALVEWWVKEGDLGSRESTRAAHCTLVSGFFARLAKWKGMVIDAITEEAALATLKDNLTRGSAAQAASAMPASITKTFLAAPQRCIDYYVGRLCGSRASTLNAKILRLCALSCFVEGMRRMGVFGKDSAPSVPKASQLRMGRRPPARPGRITRLRPSKPRSHGPFPLVWERLGSKGGRSHYEVGPHLPEPERRTISQSDRWEAFRYRRDQAVALLIREDILTLDQAHELRAWQVDLEGGRIAACTRRQREIWRPLSAEALSSLYAYLENLSESGNLSRTRLWKRRGWNAPFFVSADGGAYYVDDARENMRGPERKRLDEALRLRGALATLLIKFYGLTPSDVVDLEGPLVLPHPEAALFGSSNRLLLSLRNGADAKLLQDFCLAARGTPLEFKDGSQGGPRFFKAADGGPLSGDFRV